MGGENTEYSTTRYRFWKVWKPFVKDRVCTLEVHRAGACIILYMRSWIMR